MRVYVGAILLCDACVLLGKRSANRAFYPDLWDVFGGHVESHEFPEQALVRELREELGITPIQFTELSVLHGAAGDTYDYHVYHVTQWIGTPYNVQLEEHSEIRWVPLVETGRLTLALAAYQPLFQRLAASIGQRDDR